MLVPEGEITHVVEDWLVIKKALRDTINKQKRNSNFPNVIRFNQVVALFDAAVIDLAKVVIEFFPYFSLPLGKTEEMPSMKYIDILNSPSKEDLQTKIIEKRLFALGYKSIREQIKFFRGVVSLSCHIVKKNNVSLKITEQQLADIIEIIESRNLHVHNNGLVNFIYHEKINAYLTEINAKKKSHEHVFIQQYFGLDEYREITDDYLNNTVNTLNHLLSSIRDSILERFISEDELTKIQEENRKFWSQKVKNGG